MAQGKQFYVNGALVSRARAAASVFDLRFIMGLYVHYLP